MATKKLSHAQVVARLSNPGKRHTIPLAQLPPKYRKMRLDAIARNTKVYPGADVTAGDIARLRKPQEALQFGDASSQLAQQDRNLEARRTRDVGSGGYFDQYQQAVQGAQAQQAALAQQANATAASVAAAGQTASNQSRDAVVAQQTQQAQKVGASYDPSEYTKLADAAAATRQERAQTQVARTGQTGVSGNAFLGALVAAAAQGKIQRAGDLDTMGKTLGQQRTDLNAKKAIWRDKFFQDQVNEARQRQIENKEFNLKSNIAEANAQTAADRVAATQEATQERSETDATRLGIAQQNADTAAQRAAKAGQKKSSSGGVKPLNTNMQNTFWGQVKKTQNYLDLYKQNIPLSKLDPRWKGTKKTIQQRFPTIGSLTAWLVQSSNDPNANLIASIAKRVAAHGNLSSKQVAELHEAGIKIGTRYPTGGAVHPKAGK